MAILPNLIQRFYSHNKLSKKGYTIKYRPWHVIYVEFFDTKKEAIKRERFFKSGKGREWIKQHVLSSDSYPPKADGGSSCA